MGYLGEGLAVVWFFKLSLTSRYQNLQKAVLGVPDLILSPVCLWQCPFGFENFFFKREGKGEIGNTDMREKHWSAASCTHPNQGQNPQLRLTGNQESTSDLLLWGMISNRAALVRAWELFLRWIWAIFSVHLSKRLSWIEGLSTPIMPLLFNAHRSGKFTPAPQLPSTPSTGQVWIVNSHPAIHSLCWGLGKASPTDCLRDSYSCHKKGNSATCLAHK